MDAQTLNRAVGISDLEADEVFMYHQPSHDQIGQMIRVRTVLCEAFKEVIRTVPPSADRSAALRKLREARMDCNSAITFGGKY
jgi:hypothetical protein